MPIVNHAVEKRLSPAQFPDGSLFGGRRGDFFIAVLLIFFWRASYDVRIAHRGAFRTNRDEPLS